MHCLLSRAKGEPRLKNQEQTEPYPFTTRLFQTAEAKFDFDFKSALFFRDRVVWKHLRKKAH